MLYLIVGVIVCILITTLAIIYLKARQVRLSSPNPDVSYEEIRPKLKTGDIMLFVCIKHQRAIDDILYYSRTKLIGSDYGHVGLVYRDESNKLYMVECTDGNHSAEEFSTYLNDKGQGGVRFVDLDKLVRAYDADYGGVFAVKMIDKAIDNDTFLTSVYKHQHKTFENKAFLIALMVLSFFVRTEWLKKLLPDPFTDTKIYCSEMVHAVLHDCGVLRSYDSKIFWPNLFTDQLFDDLSLIKYSDVVTFTYAYDKIEN